MSVLAALALSAASAPALPPHGGGNAAVSARDAAGAAPSGARSANVTAIGTAVAEILRAGTNGPESPADALDRRIRRDARGAAVEYQ